MPDPNEPMTLTQEREYIAEIARLKELKGYLAELNTHQSQLIHKLLTEEFKISKIVSEHQGINHILKVKSVLPTPNGLIIKVRK